MLRKREKTTSTSTNNDKQHIDTLIGAHSVITGELSFEGAVRIDGRFEGNIHSRKGGTLIVSEGAQITGEVNVPSLILHGLIQGNVRASESLKLGETGNLNGDVEYSVMSLAEGSAINGRCTRISDKTATPASKNTVKKAPVRGKSNLKEL
ncbi:MAG: polymer-forming cytoskeletal protein [Mariprofundaceae bacterium]|nr:polymer-forming cytoskeletal protein [Mariprofundaceae bacterium]